MARGRTIWKSLVLVVCVIAGLLLATTRSVSHGNELRSSDSARLSDLVRAAQSTTDDAAAERNALFDRVESMQQDAARSDTAVAKVRAETDALNDAAGLTEVQGAGVTVTLWDAPRGVDGNYPAEASPDDLVVHQQDVQSVLNALWSGGAIAIGMQDQRIVSGSAPRCIGNTLLLHGRTYSPPYVLTAIGDPGRLDAALDAEPGIRVYKQYAARFGLGYSDTTSDRLTIPRYDGSVRGRYAQPTG